MNYNFILKDLKPDVDEIAAVSKTTQKVVNLLNKTCDDEGIPAKAMVVGSVAKKTWLRGKSDIDIFIHFPLDVSMDKLKELGLYLAYKTNDALNGIASEHYASHPYISCEIDGMEVDLVPCYLIEDGSQLKSAVDRTILHTNYIKSHLKDNQEDEVLLLKRFLDCVGIYGSDFKTGGFAGYLCELLILYYGTFENTLIEAQKWKFHQIFDLESYGTHDNPLFKHDPLVVIDPTDKNRNVAAALRLDSMVDFIVASRNFLDIINNKNLNDDEKIIHVKEFFSPLEKKSLVNLSNAEIASKLIGEFEDRDTQTLVIKFPIPKMSADALHPQVLKTIDSICEKLTAEEFSVFKYDYWTDEEEIVIFTIELNVFKQSKYYIHKGPKVWPKKACDNFKSKWGNIIYPEDDFIVLTKERPFKTAKEFLEHIFTKENIHIIKVGKNIKNYICDAYVMVEIDEFLNNLDSQFEYINNSNFDKINQIQYDYLNSLDDFLHPGQYVKR